MKVSTIAPDERGNLSLEKSFAAAKGLARRTYYIAGFGYICVEGNCCRKYLAFRGVFMETVDIGSGFSVP